MLKEIIMLIIIMFLGAILLTVRVGEYYKKNTVRKYWLNKIETWNQIFPVIPILSQEDKENDSDTLNYWDPCDNIVFYN
jgi:hypothetical protein